MEQKPMSPFAAKLRLALLDLPMIDSVRPEDIVDSLVRSSDEYVEFWKALKHSLGIKGRCSEDELLATIKSYRARVRPEPEDIGRMGITLAHCEAWMLAHGWTHMGKAKRYMLAPGEPMCTLPMQSNVVALSFGVSQHHGMPHWDLLDELAAVELWLGTEAIAARWVEVSPQRVFKLFLHLGFDGPWSKHRRTEAGELRYSPDAVALLERELLSRGYSRVAS